MFNRFQPSLLIFKRCITTTFHPVVIIAAWHPFFKAILMKSLPGSESFRFPYAFARFRSAVFKQLLPLGILLESVFSPLILLF
jgi:hypothetical protein